MENYVRPFTHPQGQMPSPSGIVGAAGMPPSNSGVPGQPMSIPSGSVGAGGAPPPPSNDLMPEMMQPAMLQRLVSGPHMSPIGINHMAQMGCMAANPQFMNCSGATNSGAAAATALPPYHQPCPPHLYPMDPFMGAKLSFMDLSLAAQLGQPMQPFSPGEFSHSGLSPVNAFGPLESSLEMQAMQHHMGQLMPFPRSDYGGDAQAIHHNQPQLLDNSPNSERTRGVPPPLNQNLNPNNNNNIGGQFGKKVTSQIPPPTDIPHLLPAQYEGSTNASGSSQNSTQSVNRQIKTEGGGVGALSLLHPQSQSTDRIPIAERILLNTVFRSWAELYEAYESVHVDIGRASKQVQEILQRKYSPASRERVLAVEAVPHRTSVSKTDVYHVRQ